MTNKTPRQEKAATYQEHCYIKATKPTGFNRDSSGLVIYSQMLRSGRANNNEHVLNVVLKQLQSQHSLEADITGL